MNYQVLDSPSVEPNESDKFVYTDYIDKFIALPSWRYSARLMAVRMNQYLMFLTTILCLLFLDWICMDSIQNSIECSSSIVFDSLLVFLLGSNPKVLRVS